MLRLTGGDIVVAYAKSVAGTRDADGTLKLYVNGELDAEGRIRDTARYRGLRIGYSTPQGTGTQGRLTEFRAWNLACTPDEIRSDFDRSDADAIVIRQPEVADVRIPAKDVAQADFTGISIMPEGLLEAMRPQEVSDLFAHPKTLTAAPAKP